jgi:hypothetical protein
VGEAGLVAEYAAVVSVGLESFDWRTQGDEWVHRVGECLAEIEGYTVTGHKYDGTTEPFIEFTGVGPDGATLDTRLVIIRLQEGVYVAIAGKTEEPDEAAAEAWTQAARCATARLGSPGTEFRWTATFAPPSPRIGGAEPTLKSDATIGVFRLVPVGHPLYEILPQAASLASVGPSVSWPILIEAHHEGYNWDAASKKAAFELHRLSALLSLAFGECLVVRQAPAPIERGVRQVPDRLWWQQSGYEGDTSPPPEPRNVVTVPDWVPDAWQRMQKRPKLAHAVTAYHEGLRAQFAHPSLALVAFIASVEAVANTLFKEERCPKCGAHRGVAARFRAAVRLVTTDEEAERLGAVYSPRSRTVHQGWLHGGETMPGVLGFSWGEDPVREFERDVWGMRTVSRDLLRRAVRGELPTSKVALEPSTYPSH